MQRCGWWGRRAAVVVAGLMVASPAASGAFSNQGQPMAAAGRVITRLVGAWHLVSRSVRRADGSVLSDPVLGARPFGRLFYDASGVMSLQMMRAGRSSPISTPDDPRDAVNPRVVLGYDSYSGRYVVDERAGTITHRVEASLFPEDLGKDFVRNFTLDGDTLTLSFTSPADGELITRTLVFARSR
jgi:hypothetical protein